MSGTLRVTVESATLKDTDKFGKPDPYVTLQLGSQQERTRVAKNTTTPTWNQTFTFNVQNVHHDLLDVKVFEKDLIGSDALGSRAFPLSDLRREERVRRLVPVLGGQLQLTFEALDFGQDPYNSPPMSPLRPGIGGSPGHPSGGYKSPGGTGYSGPGFRSTPAAIYSDRDTLLHHHNLYNQAFETIIQFFEHEDRVLTQEKLQFEEWKLAEQQLINQQGAELIRKQQELRQYEADLLGFQHSVETSEHEILEQSRYFEEAQSGFREQGAHEHGYLSEEQRRLDDQQRSLAHQAAEMEERRSHLRRQQMRQQSEQAQLQREMQKLEQQELQQRQQQEMLGQQQQQLIQVAQLSP